MTEFDALLSAMRAELDALDGDDAGTIQAATLVKLAALDAARTAPVPPRDVLDTARSLNALASARVNMLLAGIERRLAALTASAGVQPPLCYGRNGRSSPG